MPPTTPPTAIYKQLGSSGLRISVPILGCMSYGDSRWQPWVLDPPAALPLLKAAYDRGITSWDTANVYSNGASERVIAQAIREYAIPRERLVLMTKCCGTVRLDNEPATLALEGLEARPEYQNQRGLSRAGIFNAVEASLERLGTGYIDLLQIHRFDASVPVAETMKALHDLVQAGKVRYLGASSMYAYQFAQMQHVAELHGWTKFVAMQNHYSLLYREEEREMHRFCKETGVGLIPWSPLAMGMLARPVGDAAATERGRQVQGYMAAGEADRKIITAVEEIAKAKGTSMSAVALAWVHRTATAGIVGASKESRLDDALEANTVQLSEDEVKRLEEGYQVRAIWGH